MGDPQIYGELMDNNGEMMINDAILAYHVSR